MDYLFTYKRKFFKRKVSVKGHQYLPDMDRMDLFLANDKGVISIPKWSECTLYLGVDWVASNKEAIEKAATGY